MTQTPPTPPPNDAVVLQNAYTPYVAVVAASPDGSTVASELVDRIRIQGRLAAGQTGADSQVNCILIIDVSVSMREGGKLKGAIAGAIEGLHAMSERSRLGVVVFSEGAETIAPLALATESHKAAAEAAIRNLQVVGGTQMSWGLSAAREMFVNAGCQGQSNTAILLTDGDNNDDPDLPRMRTVIPTCADVFQTEALGYGTDWNEDKLSQIVRDLQGPNVPQLVRGPAQAGQFFRDLIGSAAKKTITDLRLQIETRMMGELVQVMQMVPHQEDITARGRKVLVDQEDDIYALEIPFGAFGADETRDVLVRWQLKNLPAGKTRILADVRVLYTLGGQSFSAVGQPLPGQDATQLAGARLQPHQVAAIWTNEVQKWSAQVPEVDFYTKQTAITEPLREGAEAIRQGDPRKATALLQTAYDAAKTAGATAQLSQIETLVRARADGTVELRMDVDEATIKDARLKATTSTMMTTED
jgi:uncharacterized protein YegL